MKVFYTIVALLFSTSILAQYIFPHEKEISNKNRFIFKEINFSNTYQNLDLSGTLILPKKDFTKVVVVISGSGKDTRYAHHKLSEALLKNNIAVFRFDERGVGKSQGKFTKNLTDISEDVAFCLQSLKTRIDLQDKQFGLLGHSLGAMASVSVYNDYPNQVDFLVQLASPVKTFANASKHQINTMELYKVKGKSDSETIALLDDLVLLTNKNKHTLNSFQIKNKGIEMIKNKGFNPSDVRFWSDHHIQLFATDFEKAYKNITIPTIYIIGSKDNYINPSSEITLLKKYNNPHIKIAVMDNLNHYLTSGDLSANNLYNIDKKASEKIMNWILKI